MFLTPSFTEITWISMKIMLWMSNYIHIKQCDVVTHPCPNFKGALAKPALRALVSNGIPYK